MIKVYIKCDSPEKTLTALLSTGLEFYAPEKSDGELKIEISLFSYFAAKRVLDALGFERRVVFLGTFGAFWRKKHRIGLIIGTLLGIFFFYLSTFFVWSVKIEGEGDIPEREILETLERHGFHEGVMKSRVDVNEVANLFLADRLEFSFCSINISGAVAHVELKRRIPARLPESPDDPYNLVSDSDGVVVRVEAENGIPEVKAGDPVIKGQLVVSGVVQNTVNTAFRLVRAEGRVWARAEDVFVFDIPLEYTEKRYTGEKSVSVLRVLGHRIGFMRMPEKGSYDIVSSIEKPEIFGCELPFDVERIVYAFYKEKTVTLTENEALILAHDLYRKRCAIELEGAVIEEEDFSHTVDGERLVLTCRVTSIKDICTRQKIEVK